ncbi:MAG: fatty acid desaturase [Pseudomonadota bacterium]
MYSKNTRSKLARIYADRRRLPRWARGLHALQTGLPSLDAELKETTPLRIFAIDILWLSGFMLMSGAGAMLMGLTSLLTMAGIVMTAIGILGSIGRLRRLVVGHVHEATHGIVTKFYKARGKSKKSARHNTEIILDVGTALSFSMNGQDYRREHARHHTMEKLGTLRDPDGLVLQEWGLWPGEVKNLKLALLARALNPVWHLRFFQARVKSNLFRGRPYRRLMGLGVLALLIGSAFVLPTAVWFAMVFIPFGPGYQIASMLQVITEHPYGFADPATTLDELAARTWERIPYDPMPCMFSRTPLRDWLYWGARLPGHIASRLTVLDDTMIAHGYHHLAWPVGRPFEDWWNTAARFVEAFEAGALPEGADERIVWGLGEAITRQAAHFKALARDQ